MSRRCYELEGVKRFSARAADYAFARPSYAAEAIAHILESSRVSRPRIVDVGAGTAQATNQLGRAAGFAVGLDPNLEMLSAAPREANVVLLQGRGEQLPVRTRSADLVTAFNAFHWFQPEAFLAEARRVLASDGRLTLVWNDWDDRDPFTAAFVRLMRAQAGDYPPEDRAAEIAPLYQTRHFHEVRQRAFPLRQQLDRRGVLARMRSMSYVRREGPAWEQLASELEVLFERHADKSGLVAHHYTTQVFVATPTARE